MKNCHSLAQKRKGLSVNGTMDLAGKVKSISVIVLFIIIGLYMKTEASEWM